MKKLIKNHPIVTIFTVIGFVIPLLILVNEELEAVFLITNPPLYILGYNLLLKAIIVINETSAVLIAAVVNALIYLGIGSVFAALFGKKKASANQVTAANTTNTKKANTENIILFVLIAIAVIVMSGYLLWRWLGATL